MLGPARVLWIEPRVGARIAELIEAPIMLVVIVCAARWTVRRFLFCMAAYSRAIAGALALALTVSAELSLVVPLRGLTLQDYFATRDPVSATVYYAILVIFAAMPLFVHRK